MKFAALRSALLSRAYEYDLNSAHYPGADFLFDMFLLHHKYDLLETGGISAGSHLLLPLHFWHFMLFMYYLNSYQMIKVK